MRAAIQAVTDGGHSVFSPSGSKMWLNCSGSLIPNLFAPDDSGEDAAYGTVGHSVGERWLKTKVRPTDMIGMRPWVEAGDWGYQITIDEEMLEHVERYVNWVKFLPGAHFVETRVDFSVLTPIPNQGGTADHVACTWQRMVITDLKMGKGVHVYAKDNTQALLYAVGFFLEWDWLYDFQEFEIRIAQPRRDNMDVWIVDRAYILKFMEKVKVRAAAAWVQNAPRSPSGEACQWCKVSSTCAAYAKFMVEMTEGVFPDLVDSVSSEQMLEFKQTLSEKEDILPAKMTELTTLELGKLLEWRGSVERFFNNVNDELFRRTQAGDTSPRWKIVESRSRRIFRDKKRAGQALVAAGVPPKDVFIEDIPSPAQSEALLIKAGMKRKDVGGYLAKYIIKPPGSATLASVRDSRPPMHDIGSDVFGDLTQNS